MSFFLSDIHQVNTNDTVDLISTSNASSTSSSEMTSTSPTTPISTSTSPERINVLIEFVSATLKPPQNDNDNNKTSPYNIFCILCDIPSSSSATSATSEEAKVKVVHQTDTIVGSSTPIWTIKDDSLCLLQLQNDNQNLPKTNEKEKHVIGINGAVQIQVYHSPHKTHTKDMTKSNNVLSSLSSNSYQYIGSVTLSKRTLINGNGDRKEYILKQDYSFLSALHNTTNKSVGWKGDRLRSSNYTYTTANNNMNDMNLISSKGKEKVNAILKKEKGVMNKQSTTSTTSSSTSTSTTIHDIKNHSLALRFRIAQNHEVKFMEEKNHISNNNSSTYLPLHHSIHTPNTTRNSHRSSYNTTNTFTDIYLGHDNDSTNTNTKNSMKKSQKEKDQIKMKIRPNLRYRTSGLAKSTILRTGRPNDLQFTDDDPQVPEPWKKRFMDRLATTNNKNNLNDQFQDNNNNNKNKLIKIKPYPDSENIKSTTKLNKNQIEYQTLLPSKRWIEAGDSDLGMMIYLEILKCDNLPNMDSGHFGDYTDAFVAIVFEDNLMRTDVIDDELSPRWLPWTQRAFAFPMKHPGE